MICRSSIIKFYKQNKLGDITNEKIDGIFSDGFLS